MITRSIGAVFIPVREIISARAWYARLLEIAPIGEIAHGHLWRVPMIGETNLVLDSKAFVGPQDAKPIFYFRTANLKGAHDHCRALPVLALSAIRDDVCFTFKDLDGNLLMIADVI